MTATTRFGTSRREGHDASAFYDRRLASVEFSSETHTNDLARRLRNRVFERSAEAMEELPDNSIALMVTSPPYHVGKDYDGDGTYDEYLEMLRAVFTETHRVLQPGGRAAVNVANLGRKPYIPLSHHISWLMHDIGFHMRGEIIWRKAAGAAGSCAFGSFRSASNPVLRDVHEYILVFSKGRMDRPDRGENTIAKDAFLRDTLSIWDIQPESARRVGHPAPFPIELPRRLIELYSYVDDVVLDPFMGSGTTAIAAQATRRQWVGYETSKQYARLARSRIRTAAEAVG
ncbi:MAG: site-specific DNA-methyltransferase [Actinomycetota bacterium]|nr:site-specific DNA-methyltransferase [Actinomycetota bacterium]